MADAMTLIVGLIIAVAPIGIFALVVAAVSRVGVAIAGAMAYYIIAVSSVLVLFALLMYPVASMAGGIPLRWFTRGGVSGAGGGAELELVAGVAAGARRRGASVGVSVADHRVRVAARRYRCSGWRRRSRGSSARRFSRGCTGCR